ncbi:hypothetical protein C2G38_2172293 [Gigaspora rosea]|uniref:Protein kinase domain-containing protein n=1 Tax=Gigaspora rosea TaxID=44941 RepID=A0A397VMK7_9GLOM|nr:hypothetical protein C2G38_2172293 [Gigaspora rosea]
MANSETLSEYSERLEQCLNKYKIKRFDDLYLNNNDLKEVGRGGSAFIYSTNFRGTKYALKSFKCNMYMDDKTFKTFIKELKIFNEIDHPNIIKFYGISKVQPEPDNLFQTSKFVLVLQFAKGGSLRKHLETKLCNDIYKISWRELIKIAMEITHGLKYLHDKDIIHRDLHSDNILIDDDKALIADFGISKQLNDTNNSISEIMGVLAYLDPRCIDLNKKPDKKSDIFSLGMLFWELTSGTPPFNGYSERAVGLKIWEKDRVKVVDNTPSDYVSLYKMCYSLKPDERPTLDTILNKLKRLSVETTIEYIENKIDLDINFCNAFDHNKDKYGTHDLNVSIGIRNSMRYFPFDIKKFDDSLNLIKFNHWIKELDEVENSHRKLLINVLESLSVAPEYKIYVKKDFVSHLELRLQTLNVTLEKIYYLFTLQHEFRDKLLRNLRTYIDLYYSIIDNFCPNYNINFLLIHLRDTLQTIHVGGRKKALKKSNMDEIIIIAGVSMPQNALNFLQTIDDINYLTGWYKKWRDLLSICRSLEVSTRQLSNSFSQSHKEIYLLEFIWQYVLCQMSDQTIPVANVSKEILNDKTTYLYYFNKNKGPICSLDSLWFGTLNLAQDICYTTSQPVILVASYYLGLVSLRKSQCAYIRFKSLEVLYSLLLREPEQIRDVLKEKISEFCDSELKVLIDIVNKKLKLDNKFIKSTDYVSIFQGKDLTENIVTLLKGIIKEKLICTSLTKPIGDFLNLDCKHVISRLTIINQKACPFCKLNIDPKLIYNFTSNAIIKGFYEKLEDFDDHIMSEMSERQISKNIPSESKLMKKAKIAEKQQKYSDVIVYLDKVMQYYPERYNYSAQCRKANAIWELGLRENQETAIKLHVKARDILTSAIQLKPKDSFAYICRGKIYLHHNNNVEALKDFESVQKFDPNNRDAFLYKLMILNKVEDTEFNKIIKRNKLNPTSIISLLPKIKPRKMIFGLGNSLPVRLYSLDDSTISGYVFFKIYENFIKAIKSCNQAIKNNDTNAIALGIRGISFHKKKEFPNALNDFNKVLDIIPNNKLALGWRGKIYSSMKEYEKSLTDLNEAIKLNKEDSNNCELTFHFNKLLITEGSDVFVDRSKIYLFKEHYEEALKDLNGSLDFDPNNARALRVRGEVYRKMGKYKEAFEDFKKSLQIDPDNLFALTNIAEVCRSIGKYDEAYEYLFKLDPNDPIVLIKRGELDLELGNNNSALELFNRSLSLNKDDAIALGSRGAAFRMLGKLEEALADLNKSLTIQPNNGFALRNRGATYRMMGRYNEAFDDLNKSLTIDSNDKFALQQRGISLYMMKEYKQALSDFEKILEDLNSKQKDLYVQCIGYRGAINFKLGSFEQSRSDLENAINLKPKEPYWHCQLGALLYEQKDYDTSLKELNYSINLFQSSKSKYQSQKNKFQRILMSETYHYRGLLYKAIGKLQIANSDFEKAKDLNLNHEIPKLTY